MSNLRRTRTDGRTDDGDASSRARRATDGAECIGGVESGGGDVLSRTRSVRPDFVVSGLAPGTEYSIEVPQRLMEIPIH